MEILGRVGSGRRSSTPSQPSSSSRVENKLGKKSKSLCFRVNNYKQKETKWYVFEVTDDDDDDQDDHDGFRKNELDEIAIKRRRSTEGIALVPRHFHLGENKFGRGVLTPFSSVTYETNIPTHVRGSCVGMGSVIYNFGCHYREPSNTVVCFDLQCPKSGWKNLPPMINPRRESETSLLALDGKLYVMGGGVGTQQPWPWAEVYDPLLKKWEPLPPPPLPSALPGKFGATVYASEKKILVTFRSTNMHYYHQIIAHGGLHAYDTRTNSWGEIDIDGVSDLIDETGLPVVDHTVYSLHSTMLIAYDLMRKMSSSMCHIEGLVEEKYVLGNKDGVDPILLHLGGGDKFCLFWVWWQDDGTILSHCAKIRVSKSYPRVEEGSFEFKMNASLESCQAYTLDQKSDIVVFDALLLE